MAQQIIKITQKSLLNKIEKTSLNEADKMYNCKHFRIGSKTNKKKINVLMLLEEVLGNKNCEVSEFFDKKLKGCLEKKDIEIVDLKTVQSKCQKPTVIINKTGFFWQDSVEW